MDRRLFEDMYEATAPWDIPRPQNVIVELERSGEIRGSVLDVGCGTGENALYLAAQGHATTGLDFVSTAIERARAKATERGVKATFVVGDALKLPELKQQFDTVIDCGLFHTFSDEERPTFVKGLASVVRSGGRLVILCFSDLEPGTEGPRRVTQQEISDSFKDGWRVVRIEPQRFETIEDMGNFQFSVGGPKAWLSVIDRV